MANIYNTEFNHNVAMVYTEEPGFTGFKGLDFTKIDSIESILLSGTNTNLSGANIFLSGIEAKTTSINNKLFTTGDPFPAGVQGTIVYQADLSAQYDNVDIAGYAGADISGILQKLQDGIQVSLTGVNTVNVNVTGGNLNVLNEVEIKNTENNPIPVSGFIDVSSLPAVTIAANQNVGVTGSVAVTGPLTDSELRLNPVPVSGTVTAKTEKSSTISNSTVSGSNGTVLAANEDRLELFVQNLATGVLYVKYGADADNSSFNFVLAANTASGAGDGGSISDQNYTGIVSVSGAIPNYISWERS